MQKGGGVVGYVGGWGDGESGGAERRHCRKAGRMLKIWGKIWRSKPHRGL